MIDSERNMYREIYILLENVCQLFSHPFLPYFSNLPPFLFPFHLTFSFLVLYRIYYSFLFLYRAYFLILMIHLFLSTLYC